MKYYEFKQQQEKKLNDFPIFFAFSDKQFEEGKEKLQIKDNSELLSIGAGGYIRKSDKEAFKKMFNDSDIARQEFLKDPEQLKDALIYELGNHEFCITYDYDDALEALDLDINTMTEEQKEILKQAKNEYLNSYNK